MALDSIVAARLELLDPNPDPTELFTKFNKDYFQGKLSNVTIKWSSRMTSTVGICTFKGKREGCVIKLSVPLLALRSRKDLIETLLHEMIHAYLFIVDGDKEREEHGPKFLSHMNRINRRSGCNITIYHDFDSEMEYFQSHVWRCDGPCRNQLPDQGIIRKSINRPPGPSDSWWDNHKKSCKGKFKKISEPTWNPATLTSPPSSEVKGSRRASLQKASART
ncbi:unnamed protein product [Allacma fusca]|uniref:SprT-like domain-containing protein n=1 Tax=Allacma fusca TaxID=39272 RepID=A0A8J2PJS4_9HEXA|nr:unnamed protein product [Allacma fusca]